MQSILVRDDFARMRIWFALWIGPNHREPVSRELVGVLDIVHAAESPNALSQRLHPMKIQPQRVTVLVHDQVLALLAVKSGDKTLLMLLPVPWRR